MSPARAWASASAQGAAPGVGLSAAGAALVALVTGAHGVLIIMVLVLQGLDIVTGSRRAKRNVGEQFDQRFQQQGLENKLTRDVQILVAMTFDLAAQLVSRATGIGHDVAALGVFTASLLAWMIYTEGTSVLENIRATEGRSSVWIGFRQMERSLDVKNYGEPGERPPLRRHGDVALVEMDALPPEDKEDAA